MPPDDWLQIHSSGSCQDIPGLLHESVKKAGGYNLCYRRGQDVDLWKRMFNLGMKIHTLPNVLYAWRRDK